MTHHSQDALETANRRIRFPRDFSDRWNRRFWSSAGTSTKDVVWPRVGEWMGECVGGGMSGSEKLGRRKSGSSSRPTLHTLIDQVVCRESRVRLPRGRCSGSNCVVTMEFCYIRQDC